MMSRSIGLVVGILVSSLFWSSCASTPPQENRAVVETRPLQLEDREELSQKEGMRQEGYQSYLKGDFLKAITQLETHLVMESSPEDKWLRYILYYCYLAVGKYRDALKVATLIAKEHPYVSSAYEQVGMAQLWLGEIDPSITNFKKALQFSQHFPRTFFYLGLAYSKKGQLQLRNDAFEKAKAEYEVILRREPNHFIANFEMAMLLLYWKQGKQSVKQNIERAQRALEEDNSAWGDLPKVVYEKYYLPVLRGKALFYEGEANRSLEVLLSALAFAPSGGSADVAEIYYFMGLNHRLLGDKKSARKFLSKSIHLDKSGIYVTKAQSALKRL